MASKSAPGARPEDSSRRALSSGRPGRRPRRFDPSPLLLVGPVVALVGVGILYPLGYLIFMSVHQYSPFYQREAVFFGFGQYQRLLGDTRFWDSLVASCIWVAGSVIPQFLIGLAMALLLNERF